MLSLLLWFFWLCSDAVRGSDRGLNLCMCVGPVHSSLFYRCILRLSSAGGELDKMSRQVEVTQNKVYQTKGHLCHLLPRKASATWLVVSLPSSKQNQQVGLELPLLSEAMLAFRILFAALPACLALGEN